MTSTSSNAIINLGDQTGVYQPSDKNILDAPSKYAIFERLGAIFYQASSILRVPLKY